MSREVSGPVVTVAELMRRCAPVAPGDDDTGEPVPVSTLLHREGRAGRPFERPEVSAPTAAPVRGALVRRGAIVAGALVAAGSVVALTTAMNAPGLPTVTGTYPDQGAPEGAAADAPTSALDPGTAAPTSWLPVAFPTAFASDVVKRAVAAAPAPATAAGPAQAGAAPAGPTSTSTSKTATPTTTTRSKSLVSDTTKKLGDTVDEVGKGSPLGTVTRVVGSTVTGAGRTLDATTAPITSSVLTTSTAPSTSATPTSSSPPSSSSATEPTSATESVVSTVTGLLGS